ncbi:spore germination protein [Peribacillus huizhouensis]|uniref:Spore germination protein KA n=1 Tax=Peribacillus huizhouensis TaxID=1501239 RepID=A0ABR6CLU2_9BACI|nr:spore germination protein [Peribacillus huizhouensis]MBA9025999.1 spore germination protein KA [Peribacillus huizhouensis]
MKKIGKWEKIQKNKKIDSLPSHINKDMLSSEISTNEKVLKESFQNCSDFVIRPIYISGETKIFVIYVDGLSDAKTLDEVFLKPMMFEGLPEGMGEVRQIGQILKQHLVAISQVTTVSKMSELVDGVLKANVGIIVDGETDALLAELKGYEKRGIEEPSTEVVIRGPRDGFIENLRTNTSLLRRRIRSTSLKTEPITIGEFSQTDVIIAYIDGIVQDSILDEVRTRLKRIQIDGVLESEYIEEFIEDNPYSPFPQIQNTERPDIVASSLLEGKVAILVDNTPFALVLPMTFWSGFQAAGDYYERFMYATFIRIIRFILLNVCIFFPSIYVALTTYHPKLIPTSLLISIAASRESVPFPAVIEVFLMEFMFDGLREAGIRLPKPVGSAVSIVGALVIGQAAVQAGIVSAPMVIVVATTGIASFGIPRYSFGNAFQMLRYVMLILAGCLGFYGIVIGFIALIIHLVNLRSYGVPYFSPVAPLILRDLKDIVIRTPRWAFNYRREFFAGRNKKRIPKGQKPSPKQGRNSK